MSGHLLLFMYYSIVTPPSEPPIIETPPSVTVQQDNPIFIRIAASKPGSTDTEGLEVYVDNLPSGGSFNRGRQEGDRWIFTPADFGEVELELPPEFSGRLNLMITAVANGTSRQRSLVVDIQSTMTTTEGGTTGVTQAMTEGTLVNTDGTPATTGEAQTPTGPGETTEDTPRTTGEVPTITRDTLASTGETTAQVGGTTVSLEETPGTTGEVPTITRDTPVDSTRETEVGSTTEEGRFKPRSKVLLTAIWICEL